eukprot:UN09096
MAISSLSQCPKFWRYSTGTSFNLTGNLKRSTITVNSIRKNS